MTMTAICCVLFDDVDDEKLNNVVFNVVTRSENRMDG